MLKEVFYSENEKYTGVFGGATSKITVTFGPQNRLQKFHAVNQGSRLGPLLLKDLLQI